MLFLYILLGILGLVGLLLLYLTICWIVIDPKKNYDKDSPFYRTQINAWAAIAIKAVRIRLHVTGTELIPENKKVLFVGNHMSNYDPVVTWHALKKWKPAFISKESNFKIPWFGRYIRKCCFMAIDRKNPRNAIVTINRAAGVLKNQEVSIAVYPEGTRSKSGELLPFHNGVFKIAQKAEADIVVVSLVGTNKVAKNIPFRSTDVYLDVLEVIPAEIARKARTDEIGQRVEKLLREKKEERENYGKDVCAV